MDNKSPGSVEKDMAKKEAKLSLEEALEKLTGKKVKEKVLYSFALEDTIGWSE